MRANQFPTRYPGTCLVCLVPVLRGALVAYSTTVGAWVHPGCVPVVEGLRGPEVLCRTCLTISCNHEQETADVAATRQLPE